MSKKKLSALDKCSIKAGYESYKDYLKSEDWTYKIKFFKKPMCYCCRKENVELKIRHLNAHRIGRERWCDVITTCEDCNTIMDFLVVKAKCSPSKVHNEAGKYVRGGREIIQPKKPKKKVDKSKKTKKKSVPSSIPKTPIYIKKKESKSPFTI